MDKRNKPSILTIGTVTDSGPRVIVSGWKLGTCLRQCTCHLNSATRQLSLAGTGTATLGLVKYRFCRCCEPWTASELAGICKLLAEIEAMTHIEEQPS